MKAKTEIPATATTSEAVEEVPQCDTCQQPLADWRDLRVWHTSPPMSIERPIGRPRKGKPPRMQTVVIPHHATCRRCSRAKQQRTLVGTYVRTADGKPVTWGRGITVRRDSSTGQYVPWVTVDRVARAMDGPVGKQQQQRNPAKISGLLATERQFTRLRGARTNDPRPAAPPERSRRAAQQRQQQAARQQGPNVVQRAIQRVRQQRAA